MFLTITYIMNLSRTSKSSLVDEFFVSFSGEPLPNIVSEPHLTILFLLEITVPSALSTLTILKDVQREIRRPPFLMRHALQLSQPVRLVHRRFWSGENG